MFNLKGLEVRNDNFIILRTQQARITVMRLCFLTHFWITSLTFGSLNMNDLYSVDCKIISNPYVGHHLPSIENHSTEGSTTYDATYILLMYSLKKLCAVVTKMLTCKICFSKQNYFFSNMNELYS